MAGPGRPRLTDSDHIALLAAIADGHTDAEIAQMWHMGHGTIKRRRIQLCKLLHARNSAHAVAIGYQRDLLPIDIRTAGHLRREHLRQIVAAVADHER